MNIDVPKTLRDELTRTRNAICGIHKELQEQNKLLAIIAANLKKEGGATHAATREEA